MAHSITGHTIMNGPRNLILQFNIVSDGSSEYSNFELLNINDYIGDDPRKANSYKIIKVMGRNGVGTTFQLKFGDTANNHKLFFESTADNEYYEEWDQGGLSPLLVSPDMTIRMTTLGFTEAAVDTISVTIWIKKKTQGTSNS